MLYITKGKPTKCFYIGICDVLSNSGANLLVFPWDNIVFLCSYNIV